jgi:two-component system sensor histidine kinase CiaH
MMLALAWWTYSLIQYNNHFEKRELQYAKQEFRISQLWLDSLLNQSNSLSGISNPIRIQWNNRTFVADSKKLSEIVDKLNKNIYILFEIKTENNWTKINIIINKNIENQLRKRKESKQFAWFGEGISIAFITLIIIFILYVYLDKILKFNQQQRNFLLAITHELKTPIASSSLAIQTASKINENDPKTIHILGIAARNMKRLGQLIEQVVLATKLESSFVKPNRDWTNLGKIFENIALDFGETYPENLKNLSFDYEKISLYCDMEMIQIAIANLISNSIKYSEENSVNISVKVQREGLLTKISVIDQGIGIPETERTNVFTKFYRIGDEKTRSTKGSGLGLYLVKEIAKLHGAKVSIEDNPPSGTCVSLIFKSNDVIIE